MRGVWVECERENENVYFHIPKLVEETGYQEEREKLSRGEKWGIEKEEKDGTGKSSSIMAMGEKKRLVDSQ